MRKFAVTLMASLLSCSAAFAFWPEAADSSLEVGVGYRQDRLEWKTRSRFDSDYSGFYPDNFDYGDYFADDDCFCNDEEAFCGAPTRLSSHLKWRDLNIVQIDARGRYITCDNVYLRANGDYGWITSGKNRDSDFSNYGVDYGYNNEYFNGGGGDYEFSRSRSRVRGWVYDIKLAVGYQFKLCDDNFSIAPLIGYSWHGQHLRDRHLRQSLFFDNEDYYDDCFYEDYFTNVRSKSSEYYFDSYSPESESFSYDDSYGRDRSRYRTRWVGPFAGFDFDYRFGCSCEWDIFGGYEFHWAEYHAKARWNLRSDLFDGFRHRAKNAYGHVFDIGLRWDFMECWTLAVKGQFQWWWADRGRDRARIASVRLGDVHEDCFLTIPLRDVRWCSGSVSAEIGMVF